MYEKYKKETGDQAKTVIASTASPYKFSGSVLEAIEGRKEEGDEFAVIDRLHQLSGLPIPQAVEEIRTAPIRHNLECGKDEMKELVGSLLA